MMAWPSSGAMGLSSRRATPTGPTGPWSVMARTAIRRKNRDESRSSCLWMGTRRRPTARRRRRARGAARPRCYRSRPTARWAWRDEYEADSASSQFFWLLFDSDLTPAGKNLLDGRYACFGYSVAGEDFLGAV